MGANAIKITIYLTILFTKECKKKIIYGYHSLPHKIGGIMIKSLNVHQTKL